VEAVYKKSSLVEQIWVYGNSFESILVAVVVPNEDTLKTWAAQNGMEGAFAAICRDRRTHDYLSSELAQTAKAGKLKVLGPSHHVSSGLKPHQAKYDNLDCVIPHLTSLSQSINQPADPFCMPSCCIAVHLHASQS